MVMAFPLKHEFPIADTAVRESQPSIVAPAMSSSARRYRAEAMTEKVPLLSGDQM